MFVARHLHASLRAGQATKAFSALAGLDSTKTIIHKTMHPKAKVAKETLTFGTTFTDHMLEIDWDQKTGWGKPLIRPYGPLSVDPASSSLHYALQCFEGMKAYINDDGKIRLFRPDMNMARMNNSMERLFLPTFDSEELIKCIEQLVLLDKDWIPKGDGYSLYLRPTGISTHPHIGVGASTKAKVFVILSPVGPYYPEGFNPVKLFADDTYVRAWPGGTGNTKVGGNYGATIMPQMEANKKGYSQILWLFGEEHFVTEVGTMNLFVYWINDAGEKELVTAPLHRGDILPGVTRDSILELTRGWGEFKVSEHTITMPSIVKAQKEGRLLEIFGSGTAAVISPVKLINYNGEDIDVPLDAEDGKSGQLTKRIWKEMTDIQYGRKPHPWSVVIN
ncbi:branched-chain amino acid aminotransferase [Saprolegnia diclina VS20]|uniref:Branched-chain-amino-acid aminotransferase n=1 Tax=Saprolegnia diclina (strain VS20) TaxID=1156394 RepID=T0QH55_SAPDV|nr:branched-chain amino acid aminotransferase [Saprolegnia diclina VS20]EQC34071.1 branched-chain amino acid aminotransferase [Saprolegnia diclina VS20]|eukprot:XP_008612383.1 branched-chain amino acid aminotransferase [Saprolegnia diclina VS20]